MKSVSTVELFTNYQKIPAEKETDSYTSDYNAWLNDDNFHTVLTNFVTKIIRHLE